MTIIADQLMKGLFAAGVQYIFEAVMIDSLNA